MHIFIVVYLLNDFTIYTSINPLKTKLFVLYKDSVRTAL